jgi:hypothetical protein
VARTARAIRRAHHDYAECRQEGFSGEGYDGDIQSEQHEQNRVEHFI